MSENAGMAETPASEAAEAWWRRAVFYQVYPRSFQDTNADGIGDLAGVARRLEYVADLGVDAIWISPFFASPMKDFGYDVSDFRAVDPIFGTLEDFDRVLARAHALGLKVIIDQVLSHTSDAHAWFQESRASRDNPKADWYVWADPKPDGAPPNNWLSVFGGTAWTWEPRRSQYYMHNFLDSQPDLNFHCPEMVAALLEEVRFWLARGVDGFRLDTVNFYTHDALLRDNPPRPGGPTVTAYGRPQPYDYQRHIYDKSRPENMAFVRRLRRLADHYGAVLLGELGSDDAPAEAGAYTAGPERLQMAYSYDLLTGSGDARYLGRWIARFQEALGDGWMCWMFSNHDVPRVATRWAHGSPAHARLMMMLLLSLRGTPCIYQGEELGLEEADIPPAQMRDPKGIAFYPDPVGRDGCRTPMPWEDAPKGAGFTEAEPWLPIPPAHRARCVARQLADPASMLHAVRRMIRWRGAHPALAIGSLSLIDSPPGILAFEREHAGSRVLAAFNLSGARAALPLADAGRWRFLDGHGFAGMLTSEGIELPPLGACFCARKNS